MNTTNSQRLIKHLSQFVSLNRQKRMDDVLQNRTRFLSVILEDIYQPHNASAVLRSCECLGVQDIHIIEKANRYRVNPDIALGAAQWLTLYHHENIKSCFNELKNQGYQIAAMTLSDDSLNIDELDLSQKTAICFGTEENGLSDSAIIFSDVKVKIPMVGFTQSFNISVSAAISLYTLTQKLHRSNLNWQLTEEEKTALKINWLIKSTPGGDKIKEKFLSNE